MGAPYLVSAIPDKTTEVGSAVSFNASIYFGEGTLPVLVSVPDVINQTQANAQTALTNAGLVYTTSSANHPTIATGNVSAQSPAAGSQVATGSSVALTISLGVAGGGAVVVPNVVGLSQAAATAAIEAVGTLVAASTTAYDNVVTAGNVISQNPAAGASVPDGSTINFVVSLGVEVPGGTPRFSLNPTTNPYYDLDSTWTGAQDEYITLTFTVRALPSAATVMLSLDSGNLGLRIGINSANKFAVQYKDTLGATPQRAHVLLTAGETYTYRVKPNATNVTIEQWQIDQFVDVSTGGTAPLLSSWKVNTIGHATISPYVYIKDVKLGGATDNRWYKLDDGYASGVIVDSEGAAINGTKGPTVASTDWDNV